MLFLYSEFDIAALVVHVGDVCTLNEQKKQKQWVFVTDGSITHGLQSEKLIDSLLAICFWSPLIDHHSFPPINHKLAGSTVIKPFIMDYDSIPLLILVDFGYNVSVTLFSLFSLKNNTNVALLQKVDETHVFIIYRSVSVISQKRKGTIQTICGLQMLMKTRTII